MEKLLSSLLGLTDASASQAPKEDVVCPTCGTTYEEFIKNSRSDARTVIMCLIRCLERKLRNCRKIQPYRQTSEDPAAQSGGCRGDEERRTGIQPEEQIKQLKRRLEAALQEEDYERLLPAGIRYTVWKER